MKTIFAINSKFRFSLGCTCPQSFKINKWAYGTKMMGGLLPLKITTWKMQNGRWFNDDKNNE